MHPAKSVIFFTVMSGAGFGLITLLSIGLALDYLGGQNDVIILAILAIMLSSAGLIASTFHLGNPQRAWRAFSQWRSSWLSREGVLAVLTLTSFTVMIAGGYFELELPSFIGWLIAGFSSATILATAMIYAQLRPVPRWHSYLTPSCYLSFGFTSGMILLTLNHLDNKGMIISVLLCLLLAWIVKILWWYRADRTGRDADGSTTATATGLTGFAEVRLFEAPHMTRNYLMNEMVFEIARKHIKRLRQIAFICGWFIPFGLFLLILSQNSATLYIAIIALLFYFIGLLIERWLFFAEAEHVVGLYYGKN